jgi:hypothetical protein
MEEIQENARSNEANPDFHPVKFFHFYSTSPFSTSNPAVSYVRGSHHNLIPVQQQFLSFL